MSVDVSVASLSMLMEGSGDETHPICKACSKKNRACQWETPHTRFKDYQPGASSSRSPANDGDTIDGEEEMDVDANQSSRHTSPRRQSSRAATSSDGLPGTVSSPSLRHSSGPPFSLLHVGSSTGGASVTSLHRARSSGNLPMTGGFSDGPTDVLSLTHHEAVLVHHYTENLGRWLDCTDATRQFTLGIPEKVKICSVLCQAVLSFAALHYRDEDTAQMAYQRCIALLIDRLNEDAAKHDETLLCAIVILRVYEQLNGKCRKPISRCL